MTVKIGQRYRYINVDLLVLRIVDGPALGKNILCKVLPPKGTGVTDDEVWLSTLALAAWHRVLDFKEYYYELKA